MDNKRQIPAKRIVLSFLIAALIFMLGFTTSYFVSYSKYQSVLVSQEKLKYNLLSYQLEKELLRDAPCESFDPYKFSSELEDMGSLMGILEERFGKLDKKVLEQKSIYSMLEVQHFLLVKEHNQMCNDNIPTILFFYSNGEDYKDESEIMGYIIGTFKNKHEEVMVYSFDYDLVASNLVSLLRAKYNVTQPDTVIVNEKFKITDLENIDQLETYIKKNS
jgi:hypothetical protein